MSDIRECPICFDDQGEIGFDCILCKTIMCKGCSLDFFKHHDKNSPSLPRCINCFCKIFADSVLDNAEEIFSIIYRKCKNDRILLTGDGNIPINATEHSNTFDTDIVSLRRNIQRFKNSKMQEFEQLPIVIRTCARVCYKKKYDKVMSDEVADEDVKYIRDMNNDMESRKIDEENLQTVWCFTNACTGVLDSKGECSICDTEYCLSCEKEKGITHTCKKEDVESVSYMKNAPQCPCCKIRCEKTEGCNHMTCANCKHEFSYTSSLSYNNRSSIYEGDRTMKLSTDMKKSTLKDKLSKFENKRPSLIPIEFNMKRDELDKDVLIDFIMAYDKTIKPLHNYSEYVKAMKNISKIHAEGKLNVPLLEVEINKCRFV